MLNKWEPLGHWGSHTYILCWGLDQMRLPSGSAPWDSLVVMVVVVVVVRYATALFHPRGIFKTPSPQNVHQGTLKSPGLVTGWAFGTIRNRTQRS